MFQIIVAMAEFELVPTADAYAGGLRFLAQSGSVGFAGDEGEPCAVACVSRAVRWLRPTDVLPHSISISPKARTGGRSEAATELSTLITQEIQAPVRATNSNP